MFAYHWNFFNFRTGAGYPGIEIGYLGVDLFFLLSGFVMCYSQQAALQTFAWTEYARFLLGRVFRIYPTAAFVLFLFAAMVVVFPAVVQDSPPGTYTLRGAALQLALVHNWFGLTSIWNAPTWSLSAELAAYIALPLVVLLVRRSGRWNAVLAVLCPAALIAVFVLHGEHNTGVTYRGAPLRVAAEFTSGAAIFGAWQRGLRLPVRMATWTVVILLAFAAFAPVPDAPFVALPALMLLVWLGAMGEGIIARLLMSAPFQAAGRISYSLYLLHWPVFIFWRHFSGFSRAPGWANMLMLCATVAASAYLHNAVEAPSHRLAQHMRRRSIAASLALRGA